MTETMDQLGTTPEDLYAEHRRTTTAVKLANAALKGASTELVRTLRNQTDALTDNSSEQLDKHNAAEEVDEAESYKEFEAERVAIAEKRYDSNIERSADHLQQNQAAYHEQALADSKAAGVEIKQ